MKIYGTAKKRISVFSFLLGTIHTYDAGMILDKMGIAVRTGTHCTQPVMQHYGIPATARASFGLYNTEEDIDRLLYREPQAVCDPRDQVVHPDVVAEP